MCDGGGISAGCEAVDTGGGAANKTVGSEDHVLTIDVVARMFKMSTLALRILELRGLVRRRRVGRSWIYSWFDCERIALLVKTRKAGLAVRDIALVLRAMDVSATAAAADDGRLQCLSLIHKLEDRKQALGSVLGELYRIDWELAERVGGKKTRSAESSGEPD